uniref:alanine transaminase n=1 Tax=Salarias fasciatus TaxID=181472 RepID=A0A672G368_SALFA
MVNNVFEIMKRKKKKKQQHPLVAPGGIYKVLGVSVWPCQHGNAVCRQVLALCLYPQLLEHSNFPADVGQRALRMLEACDGGSVGSYTPSSGMLYCRQRISEFIRRRDGVPSSPGDVFLPAGSQKALTNVLKLLCKGVEGHPPAGVLTPRPCPHTLPALLDEAEVTLAPYQLSEQRGWAVDLEELRRAVKAARRHCEPRAIYISNPGNPTGHVQDRESIEEVIRFAAAERLVLLVDEVYQNSVLGHGSEFISYKKVLLKMNRELVDTVELFSIHSLSGAYTGECGLRAGYIETFNMDPKMKYYLDVILCGDISTPVTGQLALDLMLNPPTPGDASYDTHMQETLHIQTTLCHNAQRGHELLNDLPGMSCQPAMGGIYLYPRLDLPSGFIKHAESLGIEADVLYCQRLLEEEGVLAGAGQDNGTVDSHHLR